MGEDVTIVLKAIDKATATIRGVEATLKRLGGTSSSVGRGIGGMMNLFAGGFTTIGTVLNMVGGIVKTVFGVIHGVLEKAIDLVMGFGHKLLWVAGILAGVATAAAVKLGQSALDMAGNWQAAEIAFTSMLGSAQKATAYLGQLRRLAIETPFTFSQVRAIAQMFLAFSIPAQTIPRYLTAISDAVSAMGGNAETIDRVALAIGQMATLGKVNARDMLQLTQAGIPAWSMLAEAVGKTTQEVIKLSEQGQLTAAVGIEAIIGGMERRFGGMSKAMMGTWQGALSNLVDVWEIAMQRVGMPLAEQGVKIVKALTNAIGRLSDSGALEKIGSTIAGWFSAENIGKALNFFANMVNFGVKAFQWIQGMWQKVIAFLSDESHIRRIAVVFLQLADYVKSLGRTIWDVFKDVYGIIRGVADILIRVVGAFKIAFNTLRIGIGRMMGWQNEPYMAKLWENAQKGEDWLTKGLGNWKLPATPQWGAGNDPRADALVNSYRQGVNSIKNMFTSSGASWVGQFVKDMGKDITMSQNPLGKTNQLLSQIADNTSPIDDMLGRIWGGGDRTQALAARLNMSAGRIAVDVRVPGGTARDQQIAAEAVKMFCEKMGIPTTGAMPMQRGSMI